MSLPPIDTTALPADIRNAAPAVQRRYTAGLAFERQLTMQLAQQLQKTIGGDDSNPYGSLIPDALADAIQADGGLGLARELGGLR
jgi:hypothetical protein